MLASSLCRLKLATRDALALAALSRAGTAGWSGVDPDSLSQAVLDHGAGAPNHDVQADLARLTRFRLSHGDVVDLIAQYLDRQAMAEVEIDPSAPAKERVFDVVMARFDAAQDHRAGVLGVRAGVMKDPRLAGRGWLATLRSADALLGQAGERPNSAILAGVRAARAHALALILVRMGGIWAKDTSADMASTMAQLDAMLTDVDRLLRQAPWRSEQPAA